MLSADRFPRARAFVEQLPAGLGSHPECRVKTEYHHNLWPVLEASGVIPELPPELRRYVGWAGEWMPDAVGNTLLLVGRDVAWPSDAAFLDWTRDNTRDLTRRPANRILMRIFSPTLIVMGSARRWAAFHQASHLDCQPVSTMGLRNVTAGRLSWPEGVYDHPLLVAQVSAIFEAVLEGTRAEDPQVQGRLTERGEARFQVSWKA